MDSKSYEKKEDFLKAAFGYLVENGLENTSVRELCRETKIASGSMYYWFDGKDDIYISAILYGISRIAANIFDFAFRTMHDFPLFCSTFLDEIEKYKKEFRLVFQAAASPQYGRRIREKAEEFKDGYAQNIEHLCQVLSLPAEYVAPNIYLLISILVDYVVWEDREASQMQLDYICSELKRHMEHSQ